MTENKETVETVKAAEGNIWETAMKNEISYAPFVNIYENNDDFILVAYMPGVGKENVKLKIEEGALTILGKINYDEIINRKYILNEAEIGNYSRKFKLSESIDESKIEARYEDGQLVVNLPKHDRVKPRSININ